MSDKNFKVKSGLQIPGVTSASILITDSSGTISAGSTLPISAGGTGQTSTTNAINALLPTQTNKENYFLQTNQTNVQWAKAYYQGVQNNGTTVNPRSILNIVGGTFTDDSIGDITTLTIPTEYISTSGGSTITASSASVKPLIIKGAASQTADLQQWQDSAGNVLSRVLSDGSISWGAGASVLQNSSGRLVVNPSTATSIAVIVKGAASQTANLQEWQNSSGQSGPLINSSGVIIAKNGFGGVTTFAAGATGESSSVSIYSYNVARKGLVIKGIASQTANLQEWQNSSGTVLASIDASGSLMVQDLTVNGTTTTINSTTLTVDDKNIELASVASPTDTTADGAGITIKGATDKTFNWVQSTAAFTSSEPISAPAFKSAGTAVSSNITLASGYKYFVDTTSARTLTLPASPSLGDEIVIYDASNNALTNNITVASNSNKVQGSVQDLIIDSNAAVVYLAYTGSTYGWAVN